ncbi:UNVERIFIED_CONTAM: hypothetical protein GTU68_012648 [Idotea baltica]|nr:hypothetical protein [Idotea baltica]
MANSKTTLALIFGGQSPEHEISILSARNIFQAIDTQKYATVLIGIDKDGCWYHVLENSLLKNESNIFDKENQLMIVPGARSHQEIDVVFPITHGPYGEDGTLQGMLRHLNLPFVGPDVLSSAVSMDKDVAKRLFREADLLTANYMCFRYYEKDAIDYIGVINQLGSPVFIKPANMGSSVGIARADDQQSFEAGIKEAFRYDHKIIIEEAIEGRELECAVLGNAEIATTHIGEVGMAAGFYDYDSKYLSDDAAKIQIPAPDLSNAQLAKLMLVAKNAYRTLECEGMSRVDMFLTTEGEVYINEINTLPGFTNISMYPQLWGHAGTNYRDLISDLIQLALEKGQRESKLEKSLSD